MWYSSVVAIPLDVRRTTVYMSVPRRTGMLENDVFVSTDVPNFLEASVARS